MNMGDYDAPDAAIRHGIRPEEFGCCDHALSIPGDTDAYELGVVADKNLPGAFLLAYDFWGVQGRKLQERIGQTGEKLKQAYTKHAAVATLSRKGFKLTNETKLANGSLQLTLKAYN